MNLLPRRFRTFVLCLAVLSLAAQAAPESMDTYFWDGNRLIRRPASERKAYASTPGQPQEKLCAASPEQSKAKGSVATGFFAGDRYFYWREGAYHTLITRREEPELGQRIKVTTLQRSADGVRWEASAVLRERPGDPALFSLRPVTDRVWMASGGFGAFTLKGRSSRLALLDVAKDGTFEIKELLDMGAKDALAPGFGALVFGPTELCVPEGWVILHKPTGFLWSMLATPEGGVRTRCAKVFEAVTTRIDKQEPFDPVILDARVAQDGTVLLATRTEEAVLQGPAAFNALAMEQAPKPTRSPLADRLAGSLPRTSQAPPPPAASPAPPKTQAQMLADLEQRTKAFVAEQEAFEGSPEGRAKRAAQDAVVRKFPEVLWWSFDPASGKLHKVDVPGAQTLLKDHQDLGRFWFRFQPDGRLVMGPPSQEAPRP